MIGNDSKTEVRFYLKATFAELQSIQQLFCIELKACTS